VRRSKANGRRVRWSYCEKKSGTGPERKSGFPRSRECYHRRKVISSARGNKAEVQLRMLYSPRKLLMPLTWVETPSFDPLTCNPTARHRLDRDEDK
jgi:hypothetical protein